MLARTVENVYWLSRYLERAENTARIIGVNTNLLLDLPGGIAPGWLPLVDISGNRAEYDAQFGGKGGRGEERQYQGRLNRPCGTRRIRRPTTPGLPDPITPRTR